MIQNFAFLPRLAVRLSAFVPDCAAADAAFMTQLTCMLAEAGIDTVLNDTGCVIDAPYCEVISGDDVLATVLPVSGEMQVGRQLILSAGMLADARALHDRLQGFASANVPVWFEVARTEDLPVLAASMQVQQILFSAGLAQACLKEGVVKAVRDMCASVAKIRAESLQRRGL